MRVAVHHPARTNAEGVAVPESVSAYRLGRIDDFVNPITGETTSKEDVAAKLLADAQAEFPDCQVVLERLVCNNDGTPENGGGTSTWVHHEQVPAGATSPDGTVIAAPEIVAAQPQEATP